MGKILDALKAIDAELDKMTDQELKDLVSQEQGAMIKAVQEDKPHLGLSLWMMSNPVEATEFIRQVKAGQVA